MMLDHWIRSKSVEGYQDSEIAERVSRALQLAERRYDRTDFLPPIEPLSGQRRLIGTDEETAFSDLEGR